MLHDLTELLRLLQESLLVCRVLFRTLIGWSCHISVIDKFKFTRTRGDLQFNVDSEPTEKVCYVPFRPRSLITQIHM